MPKKKIPLLSRLALTAAWVASTWLTNVKAVPICTAEDSESQWSAEKVVSVGFHNSGVSKKQKKKKKRLESGINYTKKRANFYINL